MVTVHAGGLRPLSPRTSIVVDTSEEYGFEGTV